MGKINNPVNSDLVKIGMEETGKTVRSHMDNKTKRIESNDRKTTDIHKSDNETKVQLKQQSVENIKNMLDVAIRSIATCSDAFAKIHGSFNNREKINKEHDEKMAAEKTNRQKIKKELEEAKHNFEIAKSKIETDYNGARVEFEVARDKYFDIWQKCFDTVRADREMDDNYKNHLFEQMKLAQNSIGNLTTAFLTRRNDQ